MAYELVSELQEASALVDKEASSHAALVIQQFARFMQDEAVNLTKYPEMTLQQTANYPDELAPAKKAKVYENLE